MTDDEDLPLPTSEMEDGAFTLEYKGVAPFPTERFMAFLSRLKVQSKDFGLVPFGGCWRTSSRGWRRG